MFSPLSGQEMEDLAAWVTSEEEASAVEREIRSKLLDSPRISFSGENTKRGALLHGVPYGVPKMEYP